MLVWDHNKDDSYRRLRANAGPETGQNGLCQWPEKTRFYFDKDGNGIIEGDELKNHFWVDDGNAQTDAGELRPLSEYGITQIILPDDLHDMAAKVYRDMEVRTRVEGGETATKSVSPEGQQHR